MLMERAAVPKAQECYGRSNKKEASRHAAPFWLSRLHRADGRLDRLQLWPAFSEVAQVIEAILKLNVNRCRWVIA